MCIRDSYEVMPGDWTNRPVTIRVTSIDPESEDGYAPSGVKSITMPDGTVAEGGTADFVADANGKYDFIITDNGGNTFTLHTGVSNIDYLAPEAEYSVTPDIWTNGPAAIHVTATDPEPEDGYAPSGVKSITMPDGTVAVSYTHLDVYKRQVLHRVYISTGRRPKKRDKGKSVK